jgi:hypothetical protein
VPCVLPHHLGHGDQVSMNHLTVVWRKPTCHLAESTDEWPERLHELTNSLGCYCECASAAVGRVVVTLYMPRCFEAIDQYSGRSGTNAESLAEFHRSKRVIGEKVLDSRKIVRAQIQMLRDSTIGRRKAVEDITQCPSRVVGFNKLGWVGHKISVSSEGFSTTQGASETS